LKKEQSEKFSKELDLDHEQVRGHRILLEFDPATPYERIIRNLVIEARTHKEIVTVITPKPSILHQTLHDKDGPEFIPFTQILSSSFITTYGRQPFTLIYDSVTELILSTNFQSAFDVLKKILKLLSESGQPLCSLLIQLPTQLKKFPYKKSFH